MYDTENGETEISQIQITEVTLDNTSVLAELRSVVDNRDITKTSQEAQRYANHFEDRKAIVAHNNGKALGFIEINPHGKVPHGSWFNSKFDNYAEIAKIGVIESERRKGVAQSLINAAEESLKQDNCSGVWVEYREDNQESRAFFTKMGYKEEYKFRSGGRQRILAAKKLEK